MFKYVSPKCVEFGYFISAAIAKLVDSIVAEEYFFHLLSDCDYGF